MRTSAEAVPGRGLGFWVLNLEGEDMGTHALARLLVSTVMAALMRAELEIKHERLPDSVAKRRTAGKGLGGCHLLAVEPQDAVAIAALIGPLCLGSRCCWGLRQPCRGLRETPGVPSPESP